MAETSGRQRSLVLETTAYTRAQLPQIGAAQIALAGRSNVGKSSLINALGRRRNLAKTSATPGKTRSINYYRVEPDGFYLVDLPGYGYARASHGERQAWARLLEDYLTANRDMHCLLLLLDCRLPPQKPDLDLVAWARSFGLEILPALTKADKCNQRERANAVSGWQDRIGRKPIVTSSQTRLGLDSLWQAIASRALPDSPGLQASDPGDGSGPSLAQADDLADWQKSIQVHHLAETADS